MSNVYTRKMGNSEKLFLSTALLVIAAVLLGFLLAGELFSFSSNQDVESESEFLPQTPAVVELGSSSYTETQSNDIVLVSSQYVSDVNSDDNIVLVNSDGSRMYVVSSGSVIVSDMYVDRNEDSFYMLRLDEKTKSVSS